MEEEKKCWICQRTKKDLIKEGFDKEDAYLRDTEGEFNIDICNPCYSVFYGIVDKFIDENVFKIGVKA